MGLVVRILTDPKSIILGVVAGFVVGFFFKGVAPLLQGQSKQWDAPDGRNAMRGFCGSTALPTA